MQKTCSNIFLIILLFCCFTSRSQQKIPVKEQEKLADSLYKAKNYLYATSYYLSAAAGSDFPLKKASSLYNAACCLGLQQKKDSAILILKKAITAGFNNKANLLADTDLEILHTEKAWPAIVKSIKESKRVLNDNPVNAKFYTEDVRNFWIAYNNSLKDTSNFKPIFKKYYFDKASRGMNDYMVLKVSSIDAFIAHIKSAPQFYNAIKEKTAQVESFKKEFVASFVKFKNLYEPAKFPDVYFIIGAFTSGGTVSDAGLLIGLNQVCDANDVPTEELGFRLKTRINKLEYLPNIIAHELIHYQQNGMKADTTTLCYAIKEGMADFIGELISGRVSNPKLFEWATGKEKIIWQKFKADMYLDKYGNWIANSQQATADNLPDQGYWIGYQVCKAYYENSTDKKEAIAAMLNIKDYKAFLEKSGWENKVDNLK